ncbi:MAG: exosortase/archaeosortase family protein [Bryobacterales bacterium]|nr:exosortase/archaeosortase family protein [Bryobacterales bacterium]
MSTKTDEIIPAVSAQVPTDRNWNWVSLLWFAGLAVLLYLPVLARLVAQWEADEDMSHGFFVPAIAAYIVWQKRAELAAMELRPNWLGLLVVVYSGIQLLVATLGVELFLARTAFVIAIWGMVLLFGGWPLLRALLFPLSILFLMVPIPAIIYNQITFPLQLFATSVAETVLSVLGYPVLREGNVLELASQRLQVVEACSGIRSLLALTFLALIYGYFFTNKTWIRVALFLSTVPIAISANAGRVTFTGILSEIDPEYATGFYHTASGWVLFAVGFVLLILAHRVFEWIGGFIDGRRRTGA